MKVIDKRGKKQANDWQVGDVVCFWEDVENKKYVNCNNKLNTFG
ncbi:hypothetical protein SD923_03370 [Lactobacillus paragasseri]|nr:hypothetical protein [Lactobacillus paragasseri]MDX5098700.1 hypothetical protein [Lactobacillus paragasseri]